MLPSDSVLIPAPSLPGAGGAATAPSGGFSRGDWSNWGLPRASLWMDREIPEIHKAQLSYQVSDRKWAETTATQVKIQCLRWFLNHLLVHHTHTKKTNTKKCKNLAPSAQVASCCSRK